VLAVEPSGDAPQGAWRRFVDGVVLQTANPKALLFFTAFLPQFVDPRESLVVQVAILGVTSEVLEFLVLLGYGALAGRMRLFASRPRSLKVMNRMAGSMLIAAGVGMAATRR
jgi:homoserine/homoserine lactone efflux protein